jgi:pyridinium-3,5-biscarboxylic acid mononucleotide sulfurtransferase
VRSVDHARLLAALSRWPNRIVACSGGVDSLLLATVAHRQAPTSTVVAHAVTPAVPRAATQRVTEWAAKEGWSLGVVRPGEFGDERYLANPTDRCYYCKDHLYASLDLIRSQYEPTDWTVLSGANVDDLGEYRPGLTAAAEHDVWHPFVEAGLTKAAVRGVARQLGLEFAELAASPCLASRLYTGTRVTPTRLRAVEAAEELVRQRTGVEVIRCRLREDQGLLEVRESDRHLITPEVVEEVRRVVAGIEPGVVEVQLDERAYRPGRAILTGT